MKGYMSYVRQLKNLRDELDAKRPSEEALLAVQRALDGEPAKKLRSLVSLQERRRSGAFFTSSTLARNALTGLVNGLDSKSVLLDPACGGGDLLLTCLKELSIRNNDTFQPDEWTDRILGIDIHSEFAALTRVRLSLWSKHESLRRSLKACRATFGHVYEGDACEDTEKLSKATHIVVNPPFAQVVTYPNDFSGNGLISLAAIMMAHIVERAEPGTRITAILPDVLRSGTRYARWREYVGSRAAVGKTTLLGQFDSLTDVHVFAQDLTVRCRTRTASASVWPSPKRQRGLIVGDLFDVSIGSVVDYRDPKAGAVFPYLVAKDLPKWRAIETSSRKRRFSGRSVESPFLVVRRTSRPGDRHRAVATIIDLKVPAVVDNHLVVLSPKSGRLTDCIRAMRVLKSRTTTEWLDQRIRCRHLTTSSLAQLPLK